MRTAGTLGSSGGYGLHDHLCLVYDRRTEFHRTARSFLADGLARGLQVRCVVGADGATADLRADLHALAPGRPDALRVDPLLDTYGADTVVEPAQQVRAYAAATAGAVERGFAGLRVVADVTPLVRTPEQRDAFARYEHLVDRYMTDHPFSALCAYDRSELGADSATELACMHPVASAGSTAFQLHAAPPAGAAVRGEIDVFVAELFGRALERSAPVADGGEVVIDGTELGFVDHHGLLALAAYAERAGVTVVLRTARPGPRRLVELLGIPGVRVERPE